ncbi:MAG: DUF2070 family protein, partial [Methanomicrobiales archaeon]|nr:DUF2070 family protein [Methanomicrobiales archaeon]
MNIGKKGGHRSDQGGGLLPPAPHVKMETLTRFLFTSPHWQFTASAIILFGLLIDLSGYLTGSFPSPAGTILFTVPALIALILTTPLVTALHGAMTWNRSALLALICSLLSIVGTLGTFLLLESAIFPFLYAYTLGFIVALRLLVLTAVADYRLGRTILPASIQSIAGIFVGALYFDPSFIVVAVISTVALALGGALLIWLIELPLYRAFGIHGLQFINLFLAHLTDGSRDLEDFFRAIGEEATVPQANLLIRRKDRPAILVTVPNLHPGPMGDIGGTNLPSRLHDALPGEVFVCHGCATHDFNLVAGAEIDKVITAVRGSLDHLTFSPMAGASQLCREGTVQVLCQSFGDTILLVATRSPLKTEDVDPAIGEIIMAEGRKEFAHVAFVDAHNCMTDVTTPVHPSTPLAREYIGAARAGVKACRSSPQGPFRAGAARVDLPYTREDGFGPMGIQALVIEAGGQRTAYVLLDGNNIIQG